MTFTFPDGGGPLAVGDEVPDFTLKLATREGIRDFRLKDHLGVQRLVFSFFPMAFTRVCTTQVCEMRDQFADLAVLDADVYGFSTDTAPANREYARMHDLPYGILSDPNYEVVPRIWRTMTVAGVEHRAMRGAMVVSKEGLVEWIGFNEVSAEWLGIETLKKVLEA